MGLDNLPELGKAESSLSPSLLAPKALPPTGRKRIKFLCAEGLSALEGKGGKKSQKDKNRKIYRLGKNLQSLNKRKRS